MNKNTTLSIRCSVADRELIAMRAQEAGLSQSDYVLQAALGKRAGNRQLSDRMSELEARVKKLEEPGRGWVPQ